MLCLCHMDGWDGKDSHVNNLWQLKYDCRVGRAMTKNTVHWQYIALHGLNLGLITLNDGLWMDCLEWDTSELSWKFPSCYYILDIDANGTPYMTWTWHTAQLCVVAYLETSWFPLARWSSASQWAERGQLSLPGFHWPFWEPNPWSCCAVLQSCTGTNTHTHTHTHSPNDCRPFSLIGCLPCQSYQEGSVQNGHRWKSRLYAPFAVCVISKFPYYNALRDCLSW